MKKLCIQICEKALLTIEVTEEMEQDFYECWDKAEHTKELKDCDSCSWHGQNVTEGTSACEIVVERGSRDGKIIWNGRLE